MKQRYYYRWFQYLLLSVFAYGLYACQSTALKPGEQSLNHIPASSLLTLNKPLVIPAQLARVYLQAGHIVTTGELNRYNPFCNLEVNTLHSTPVTISPDTFTITRIKSYFENKIYELEKGAELLNSFINRDLPNPASPTTVTTCLRIF